MKRQEIRLKNIISLEDFFRRVAEELRKRIGFKRFHFLVADDRNGNFSTKLSTDGNSHIRLTEKELELLGGNIREDIFYPQTVRRYSSFLERILLFKFNWKIRRYGITAIMPIYSEDKIICLILFTDRLSANRLNGHSHYLTGINQEIAQCLEAILLYNQALERINRKII